jgi:hypothetical protein
MYASLWVEGRPSFDVYESGHGAHNINSTCSGATLGDNITTSTNPNVVPPLIPISEHLNISPVTNPLGWVQAQNQRAHGIATLNNSPINRPPPLNDRAVPEYINAIGNMQRCEARNIIRNRMGVTYYEQLRSICTVTYLMTELETDDYFDFLWNSYCLLPGIMQDPNSVAWHPHHFDKMVLALLGVPGRFEVLRRQNMQQYPVRATQILSDATQACTRISQCK